MRTSDVAKMSKCFIFNRLNRFAASVFGSIKPSTSKWTINARTFSPFPISTFIPIAKSYRKLYLIRSTDRTRSSPCFCYSSLRPSIFSFFVNIMRHFENSSCACSKEAHDSWIDSLNRRVSLLSFGGMNDHTFICRDSCKYALDWLICRVKSCS